MEAPTGVTVLASHSASSSTTGATIPSSLSSFFGWSADTPPTLSSNGNEIAYYDAGSNLVTNQGSNPSVLNVFLNVATNSNTLVTHTYASATTEGDNPQNQVAIPGTGPVEATDRRSRERRLHRLRQQLRQSALGDFAVQQHQRDNVYLYDNNPNDSGYGTNVLVSNNGTAGTPDAGGGTAPSISSTSAGTFVTFADLNIPSSGSLSGPAPTVNVRVFTLGSSSQPTTVGQSFVSTDPALPPLTGTGDFTAATLELYSAALQPTLISADGSTIIWSGPAAAGDNVSGVADPNYNLDVFQATNPSDSSSSSGQVPVITSSNTDTLP